MLVAFLLAAAILALQRDQFLLAGILMALTTIKPQMTLLAVLYLLVWSLHDWRSRRRFCVGFLLAVLSLVGASLTVWPLWIQSWIHALLEYHRYAQPALISQVLVSRGRAGMGWPCRVRSRSQASSSLRWHGSGKAGRPHRTLSGFCFTFSLVLAITTVTLLPGQAVYDHVILLPGILLLAAASRANFARPDVFRALCWR